MSKHIDQYDDALELFEKTRPLFTILGDAIRQQIVMLLLETRWMSVNQITDSLPLSRPAVSHHLKLLVDAGLATMQKDGTTHLYGLAENSWIEIDRLEKLAIALKNCNKWKENT